MKILQLIGGISAVVLTASMAQAGYVSSFHVDHNPGNPNNVGADFLVDQFGSNGPNSTAHFNASNLLGGFVQDVPPAGGLWNVIADVSFAVDLDGDGIDDMVAASGPTEIGHYVPSPGPTVSPFVFTYFDVPEFTFIDPNTGTPILLSGLTLNGQITIGALNGNGSGSFGAGDNLDFIITDPNGILNGILQGADVDGNGFFNGFFTGSGTVDFQSVPLPSSFLLGLGLLGGMGIITLIRRRA